jgi:hypothetical protein
VDRVCLGVIFLILLKKQRRNAVMPRRRIGQETMFGANEKRSSLDEITALIDWAPIERQLDVIHAAPRGSVFREAVRTRGGTPRVAIPMSGP